MVNGPIRERIGLNSAFGVFGPESMAGLWNSKHFPLYSHTMLVVGPEHARTFADGGGSKEDLKRHLHETVRRPYSSSPARCGPR